MIYTKMKYIRDYLGIQENLDKAIEFLCNHDLRSLELGRNEVADDQVFINRFNYQTIPMESGVFEAHEKHLDIHLLLSGKECIAVSDMEHMKVTGKDTVNDSVDCNGPVEQLVPMEPGDVLILFPEDAHMVKIQREESCQVEKAVVKVLFL